MIGGVTGGTYQLLIANEYPTSALSFASSNADIANALSTAARTYQSYGGSPDCTSFRVVSSVSLGGTTLQLDITMLTDNPSPLSAITVFTENLTGTHLHYFENMHT